MFSDKLLTLLAAFSKVERNRFRKYLQSPYLNDQADLTRLFELSDEALRRGSEAVEALGKTQVWAALYPSKSFDDAHLRRLASDLGQAAFRFLAAENRPNEPFAEALEIQKALEKPGLEKHLAGAERQLRRAFEQDARHSTEHYLARFRMHHMVFNRASKGAAPSGYAEKILPADFYLECFYLAQKLEHYVALLLYSGARATEQKLSLPPGFWEYLDNERFKDVPLLGLYRKIIACFSDLDDEQHFRDLLAHLEKHADELTKENLRECYQIAQNYCAFKVNQGRIEYYEVFFGLFKSLIRLGILVENEQISEGVFKNIVTIGLRVGEFGWVERFIHDYATYLPASIRENARTFNLANLYAHQKQHQKVIELLRNVEYSDLVYALGSKTMLLCTYYEADEQLALGSLIDSFRIYLRRNQLISKNLKREYLNFLNLLRKLSALRTDSPRAAKIFRKKVEATPSVPLKKWLLEQIDVLAK
jgi:hypothetical protein